MSRSSCPSSASRSFPTSLSVEPLEPRLLLSAVDPEVELFSTTPALFAANEGQWDDAVHYVHNGSGASVAHTDAGIAIQLFESEGADELGLPEVETASFSVTFPGSSNAQAVGLDQAETVFNYCVGDESQWRSGVATYERVGYSDLWAGIDLHTWGLVGNLKYEFHVAPGADPDAIRLAYDGGDGLWLDEAGNLHVETALGELVDDAPYIYQESGGVRTEVEGAYVLLGGDQVGFELTGSYDPGEELIVDPLLDWSFYMGGAGADVARDIAVDPSNSALVAGYAYSSNWASADNYHGGISDAFVAKLDEAGQHVWSTYLGRTHGDRGWGVALAEDGSILVAGTSEEDDPAEPDYNLEAAVWKLEPNGSFEWVRYLDDGFLDHGRDVAVDEANAAVWTTGFRGTQMPDYQVEYDAYAARFDLDTGAPEGYTAIGGDEHDYGHAIAAEDGNVYVAGETHDSSWTDYGFGDGGGGDAFVVKIGGASVYLGGSGSEYAFGMAIDSDGDVVVAGPCSESSDWPPPDDPDDPDDPNPENQDAFAATLDSSLDSVVWATRVGDDQGVVHGVAVDAADNILLAGSANNEASAWVGALSEAGADLWSMEFGGDGGQSAFDVAADSWGNALVAGKTESTDWLDDGVGTGGYLDGFVAKIDFEPYDPGDELLWGLDASDKIYVREGMTESTPTGTSWSWVTGNLAQISVGEAVAWGVNSDGGIFCREGISSSDLGGTSWSQVTGSLAQVSAGEMGLVWGLNSNGGIFVREGVTAQDLDGTGWGRVTGSLSYVSAGEGTVWGVNSNGGVFVREGVSPSTPAGTSWTQVSGQQLELVSTGGNGLVWGVDDTGAVYVRQGVTENDLDGDSWDDSVSGTLGHVSCGFGDVWAMDTSYDILRRTGVDPDVRPEGFDWETCPGDMVQVSVGLSEVRGGEGMMALGTQQSDAGLLAEMELLYQSDDPWSAGLPEDEEQQPAWQAA